MARGKVAGAWVNSPQADSVAEYYVQGHSVRETAEHFGITKDQVNNLAKCRRLTNGKDWHEVANGNRTREAEKRLEKKISELGFDYLGGYTSRQGKVRIRCCKCGNEYERTVDHIQKGNVICRKCEHDKAVARMAEEKQLAKQQSEVRKLEREWYQLTHPPKDKRKEALLDKTGICEICGKPYTVREYVKSCGMKYARDGGVCSDECRRIKLRAQVRASHKGRLDSHRHRAKKYGCEYDPSVTLKRLIKRDGLRCAICGGMCDPNDHTWSKYSGPLYPSIDHIIPMAKGGNHTWDNVQVAHIICNSNKGDTIESA